MISPGGSGRSGLHQPRSKVGFISQRSVGSMRGTAIRADTHLTIGKTNLQVGNKMQMVGQDRKLQRRKHSLDRIVIMGNRGPEHDMDVVSFIPHHQLKQRSAILDCDLIHPTDE